MKITKDTLTPALAKLEDHIKQMPEEAYDYFRSITPKRSGNARRNTRLRGNTIDADYAYAQPLDSGSSKQAPRGMSEPTFEYLQDQLDDTVRKL